MIMASAGGKASYRSYVYANFRLWHSELCFSAQAKEQSFCLWASGRWDLGFWFLLRRWLLRALGQSASFLWARFWFLKKRTALLVRIRVDGISASRWRVWDDKVPRWWLFQLHPAGRIWPQPHSQNYSSVHTGLQDRVGLSIYVFR